MEYILPLISKAEIAEDTMVFTLDRSLVDYNFIAGQYANFTIIDPEYTDDEGSDRDFSIASPPEEVGVIQFASRMRDTAFKNSLKAMPLGALIKVTKAMGHFTLHQDASRPAVFLAGGIGITPFRSIVRSALTRELPHQLHLFCSNRTETLAPFQDELLELTQAHPNLTLVMTLTDEAPKPGSSFTQVKIDGSMLKKYGIDVKSSVFYTAGPPAMTEAMREMLVSNSVPEDSIRTEDFAGY